LIALLKKGETMKNILFQKIPMDENGYPIISLDNVSRIHEMVERSLPEDYVLITSPLELSKIDGNVKIIHIDCKEYSYNELKEIIEKADMYDGLCK
jgi:hypothetical protein